MKKILCGDNMLHLKEVADNTYDAVVTDPPYGLKFMNRKWDYDVPDVATWKEILRVLKPGAHILVACGTRTQHRMAVNIEDAGFEIRDVITWHYGSGFPKSMDVSKAIDREAGAERKVVATTLTASGGMANVNKKNKEYGFRPNNYNEHGNIFEITEPSTDEAKKWQGWGTALKPSTEFWTLARKPISESTVAKNILKWGVGGINIDGSRVGTEVLTSLDDPNKFKRFKEQDGRVAQNHTYQPKTSIGRFPANLILSHSLFCEFVGLKNVSGTATSNGDAQVGIGSGGVVPPLRRGKFVDRTNNDGTETVENWNCHESCPVRMMDEQAPETGGRAPVASGHVGASRGKYNDYNSKGDDGETFYDDGLAGASRFFYVAKPSRVERNDGVWQNEGVGAITAFKTIGAWHCVNCGRKYNYTAHECPKCGSHNRVVYDVGSRAFANTHETVKPIKLMEYLIKLIVPDGGVLLDPFAGSGTTGCAAENLHVDYVLIERDQKHCRTARERCEHYREEAMVKDQPTIFDIL